MNIIQPGPIQYVRVLRAGLIVGVVAAAYNMILAAAGLYTNTVLAWAVLGIECLGVAWIMIRHGDASGRFLRNLLVGIIGVAIIAVVLAPSTWLQFTVVAPDYADVIVANAASQWESRGLDAAEVAARADRLRQNYTPARQTGFVFVGTFLTVTPIVLLLAGGLWLYGRRSRVSRA